eukprot:TRINITY_DN54703_c0_g1_i1.p1 TRINITY_DN54703_c0_g1~~TRINITY_DN54703_c0_g1_i1.p1  ORF type:complete len:268 (+),score=105.60 TRINITY_DN54703_c0_g1_i1:88-804(+)
MLRSLVGSEMCIRDSSFLEMKMEQLAGAEVLKNVEALMAKLRSEMVSGLSGAVEGWRSSLKAHIQAGVAQHLSAAKDHSEREAAACRKDCQDQMHQVWESVNHSLSENQGAVTCLQELTGNTFQQCQVLKHDVESMLAEMGVAERAQLQQEVAKVSLLMASTQQEIDKLRCEYDADQRQMFEAINHSELCAQAHISATAKELQRLIDRAETRIHKIDSTLRTEPVSYTHLTLPTKRIV